jgi:hypothetical protein
VRAYLTDLSSPFSDNALSSWVTAQTVADEIYESVKPPDDETAMSWIEFVKIILHLADPVTHDISGHVADLLDFGVWAYGASTSGVPTGGEFRVKANKLGKELADRAEKAKLTYERVGDAIVSDYATLKELGTHAGCNPTDKECPPQWAFTTADQVRASVDVYRATEALAYEKLVPLAYRVYALDPPAQLFKPRSIKSSTSAEGASVRIRSRTCRPKRRRRFCRCSTRAGSRRTSTSCTPSVSRCSSLVAT